MTKNEAVLLLRKAKADGIVHVPPIGWIDGTDIAIECNVALALATGLLHHAATVEELVALIDLGAVKYSWGKITLDDLNTALRSILPFAQFVAE